jgi:hypothetical protein
MMYGIPADGKTVKIGKQINTCIILYHDLFILDMTRAAKIYSLSKNPGYNLLLKYLELFHTQDLC